MDNRYVTVQSLWSRKTQERDGFWAEHAEVISVTREELEALEEAAFERGQNSMLEAGYSI